MPMELGPVGVWLFGGFLIPADEVRKQLARLDALGYGSVWIGEGVGGLDVFAQSAVILGGTGRIVVGTGIANVWARQPETAQAAARVLVDAHPGRFVLGVGIGHPYQAQRVGEDFGTPLARMRHYLARMDAEAAARPAATAFPRVLGALGPKMLELSRDAADGAHPFFMPVEHTGMAREILGPGKLLIPHQTVLLDPDPVSARQRIREEGLLPLSVPAYAKVWRTFGYTADSDELADAAVAWGDEDAIAARVRAQLDAGADHVLVTPVGHDLAAIVDQLERLAPVLTGILA